MSPTAVFTPPSEAHRRPPSLTAWAVLGSAIFPSDSLLPPLASLVPSAYPVEFVLPSLSTAAFVTPSPCHTACVVPPPPNVPPTASSPLVPRCSCNPPGYPTLSHSDPLTPCPLRPRSSPQSLGTRAAPPPPTGPGRPSPASSPPAGGAAYSSRKAASRRYGNRFPRPPPSPPREAASQSAPTSRVGEVGGPGRQNGRRFRST